jgi:hypothetical protein
MTKSKNLELLCDFAHYCKFHPEERFWQCLRNWSGRKYIYITDDYLGGNFSEGLEWEDTFYWEGKNK